MSVVKTVLFRQSLRSVVQDAAFTELRSLKELKGSSESGMIVSKSSKDREDDLQNEQGEEDSLHGQLKATKLLDLVLNIKSESEKKEILDLIKTPTVGSKSPILIRAKGRLQSNSSKQESREEFNNVSPLEAAARCGDFYLVDLLLEYLPDSQKLEAGLQLHKIITSDYFLSAFIDLEETYQNLIEFFPEMIAGLDGRTPKQCIQIVEDQWARIGQFQKNLSNIALNLFCSLPRLNKGKPDFKIDREKVADLIRGKEPVRECLVSDINSKKKSERECAHHGMVELDLDEIGYDTPFALYKGGFQKAYYCPPCPSDSTEAYKGELAIVETIHQVMRDKLIDVTLKLLKDHSKKAGAIKSKL